MSQILQQAIKDAAKEAVLVFIQGEIGNGSSRDMMSPGIVSQRKDMRILPGFDFSDEEMRMIKAIEKKPGMKQIEIVNLMSVSGSGPDEVTCESATVKVLLANLVKRKVLLSSSSYGYRLNDGTNPPPIR